MIDKPIIVLTSTIIDDFHVDVKDVLNEHVDIVVDDLPNEFTLLWSISVGWYPKKMKKSEIKCRIL